MAFQLWAIYAFVALIGFFLVNFLFKVVSHENPLVVSLILYSSAVLTMLALILPSSDISMAISKKSAIVAAFIGLFSVGATIFALKSVEIAPNPGYSVAIYSAGFVFVVVASVFAFGSEITMTKFVGILAVFAGMVLLAL